MESLDPARVGILNIEPLGRASSVFFQGLLDGHPEILTLPLGVMPGGRPTDADGLWEGLDASRREYAPEAPLDRAAFMSAAQAHLSRGDGALFALFGGYAAAAGRETSAVRWLCYHTHSFEASLELLREHPEARFVFLIRDPRASFASMKKRGDLDPRFQHHRFLNLYRHFMKRLGGDALLLRHEDIHLDFERTLARFREFLGIADDESLRESSYYGFPYTGQAKAFASTTGLHSNRPDPRYVSDDWKRSLSPAEVAHIERTASDLMRECGYQPCRDAVTGSDFDYARLKPQRRWRRVRGALAEFKDAWLTRLRCAAIAPRP